jgi:hypothetical protein
MRERERERERERINAVRPAGFKDLRVFNQAA